MWLSIFFNEIVYLQITLTCRKFWECSLPLVLKYSSFCHESVYLNILREEPCCFLSSPNLLNSPQSLGTVPCYGCFHPMTFFSCVRFFSHPHLIFFCDFLRLLAPFFSFFIIFIGKYSGSSGFSFLIFASGISSESRYFASSSSLLGRKDEELSDMHSGSTLDFRKF